MQRRYVQQSLTMYFGTVFFVFFSCAVSVLGQQCEEITDFYWRAFEGQVPCDAFVGAISANGDVSYPAQGPHDVREGINVPGEIRSSELKMLFEFEKLPYEKPAGGSLILCTKNPNRFEWVPTRTGLLKELAKTTYIIRGGYQPNTLVYVGRVEVQPGVMLVGKVLLHDSDITVKGFYGMHPTIGYNSTHYFDVLTYK